jgi:phosphate transport system substrate-binding protein
MRHLCKLSAVLALGLSLGSPVFAQAPATAPVTEITGAGSTFVFPIMSKWAVEYNDKRQVRVNYQSIGSGAGLAQIKASAVDFGASDVPLASPELATLGLGQFPLVIGGVVPVVNIAGVEPGSLKFSGPVLADIFLGTVTSWNDPSIAALNPGAKLPASKITVVYRSDNSGTTWHWVDYLSRVSPAWKARVGTGTSVKWPVGLGAKGSEGVAAYVKQMPGSIGYIEYAYVKQNKLSHGLVKNKSGQFVQPGLESFQAAASSADWGGASDFNLSMIDADGPHAWPVTAATFVVMPRQSPDAPRRKAVHDFFRWALEDGKSQAASLDYAPLPEPLIKQIEAYWSADQRVP